MPMLYFPIKLNEPPYQSAVFVETDAPDLIACFSLTVFIVARNGKKFNAGIAVLLSFSDKNISKSEIG